MYSLVLNNSDPSCQLITARAEPDVVGGRHTNFDREMHADSIGVF